MAETPRASHLRRKYGLTVAQFDRMVESTHGRCPICMRPFKKTPCVDHDHRPLGTVVAFDGSRCSGQEIRGALCIACNRALGYFWTRDRLLSAWHYLDTINFTGLFLPKKKRKKRRRP